MPADGLILDLEDAVTPDKKAATRPIVRQWLESRDFGPRERWVRMNPIYSEYGETDLEETIAGRPHGYVVPKPRHAGDIRRIVAVLERLEQRHGLPWGSTRLVLIATETPEGLLNIREVAAASPRIAAVSWGIEDLSAAMGLPRTRDAEGRYLDIARYARVMCAVAAAAAGVEAIDTVYTDIADLEGLRRECQEGRVDGLLREDIHPSRSDRGDKLRVHTLQGGRRGSGGADRGLRGARAPRRGGLRLEGADDGHAASHARAQDRGARPPCRSDLSGRTPRRRGRRAPGRGRGGVRAPGGPPPLFNQDEVRYAMLAREVVDHSRWILPHVRGEVYLNKPPLFFWAVALVSLPAGGGHG